MTETALLGTTAIGLVFVLTALMYLYTHRSEPTKRTYLAVAVLGLVGLVVGMLFSTVFVVAAAITGYWSDRTLRTELPTA
jgi:uncharacterized membrane protein